MLKILLILCASLLFSLPPAAHAAYRVEDLGDGLYAALAIDGEGASSNAFFVVGESYVVAGGAHMTRAAIAGLLNIIPKVTSKPLRYFVLPHHHRGFSYIDFDFPAGVDVIMTWQTREALRSEVRQPEYPILFFSEGLTLDLGKNSTVVITEVGRGHSEGDLLVYLPERKTLFTSDLLYVNSVGYLGDGYMREWITALEFIEQLQVKKIIPGHGPVSKEQAVTDFIKYFKSFLSKLLAAIEQGKTLEEIRQEFALPRYRQLEGYERFMEVNLERAYQQLQETLKN
ncbi:MAG: MBL fold metallo-hydrolase [Desulfuromonadales bacterium]|nr:MBL fold metallo-hydrolase [Desulfuromonadales bacterium]